MLCLAALKSLAINKALKVDINGITVLSSALTGQQTAVAVLHALHFGVNICLVDISWLLWSQLNRHTRPVQLRA